MGPTSHNIVKIKLLYFLFILTIIGLSCENSKFPDGQFFVQDVKYGTCKPATKSELNEYWIEDNSSKTDRNSFNEYFPLFVNYFITSSKTIREKEPDKDILFYLIQLEKDNNIVDVFNKNFNSESSTSVYYFISQ